MAGPTGTLGTIETLTIAGRVFTSVSTIKHLYVFGSNNYTSFRAASASTGYVVTTGKTLQIRAVIVSVDVTSAAFTIGYGDTNVQGGAAPTTPVYLYTPSFAHRTGSIGSNEYQFLMSLDVPASKIPFFQGNNANTYYASAFGVEV